MNIIQHYLGLEKCRSEKKKEEKKRKEIDQIIDLFLLLCNIYIDVHTKMYRYN